MRPTAAPPYFPFPHRTMAEFIDGEIVNSFQAGMTRTCPKCGAAPGHSCVLPCGKSYGGSMHAARRGA